MGVTKFSQINTDDGYQVSGTDAINSSGEATALASGATVGDSDGTSGLGLTKSAFVVYDFSVDGGTAGTITLTGAPTIPDNAVVAIQSYDVITTLTSATNAATVKLSLPTDGDLNTR